MNARAREASRPGWSLDTWTPQTGALLDTEYTRDMKEPLESPGGTVGRRLLQGALTLAQLLGFLGSLFFLGQALMAMLVYVWSRRSPQVRVNFFGLLNFQAPFLPWALMGFSMLLGNSVLTDLLGIVVGHIYYFLEDVFPNQPGGKRLLLTPSFLKLLLDDPQEDPNYLPLPEEQPEH